MLVIPTRIPPHKVSTELADGKDRLQMCRLAFAGQPEFEVSDIELCRTEPSYTVDTLEALHARCPPKIPVRILVQLNHRFFVIAAVENKF